MGRGTVPQRRRLTLFTSVAAALFACPCWQDVWFFTCYDPIDGAVTSAERAAADRGYEMRGFRGDFVSQPDQLGGCEVRFAFHDWTEDPPRRLVTVQLRRPWCLGGWRVTQVQDEPVRAR